VPLPEQTILTKWGRLTGAQWLAARQREALDKWWTPQLDAYLADNWPTPEQIQANQRHWAQQKRAARRRTATAQAIASVALADCLRSRAPAPPQQLAIL
jgi:hypothetical protein